MIGQPRCQCLGLTCGECRATILHPTDMPTQGRLRELRLWHWQQMTMRRTFARRAGLSARYAKAEHRAADFHLRMVQTLNDFFALGDTAERDAARQDV